MLRALSTVTSAAQSSGRERWIRDAANRSPAMFVVMFTAWVAALVWFGPRLVASLGAAEGPVSALALGYITVFITIAWLYGFYNLSVITFAIINRLLGEDPPVELNESTPVGLLYTTCNDFVEAGALSCVRQQYAHFRVYILDDSTDPDYRRRIDNFAGRYANVRVVRREDRSGFKAGNLNHALAHVSKEPLFVIADSDEVLPRDFLARLVPRMAADRRCGFIQANHCCAEKGTRLQRDMSVGIDVHWKWYQPLRNRFGFVMFLGHGALLRRSCWEKVGGFPEIVSEDLAYAIAIRDQGYYGKFAQDVTCYEEFPDTVRAFRVRHVKWTRGTCEFLHHYGLDLLRSRRISWPEKLDILFPTVNLPITLLFFIYMVVAAIVLPLTIGRQTLLTIEIGTAQFFLPVVHMPDEMSVLYTWDFFTITLITMVSPLLCFVLELWRTPVKLFRFLTNSTALYAALAPLSTICVAAYLKTRRARFLVTGDKGGKQRAGRFWDDTHPDAFSVRGLELLAGAVFATGAAASFQVALFGLAVGYALMPLMNHRIWGESCLSKLAWVPFTFILAGIGIGGMSLVGLQPVFFGFGFHF